MKSSLALLALIVGVLAAAGALAQRVVEPVAREGRGMDDGNAKPARAIAGRGGAWALLGSWRALAADALWLRLHLRWEACDLDGANALVRRVPAVDPRPIVFWLNGARMIAYDFAAWRIQMAGGYARLELETQQRIRREQARSALRFLDEALAHHEGSAALWIERAALESGPLRDFGAAAESYRRAAEQKNAPGYAARLHAEMLRRAGRNREALAWLVALHPTLRIDDETAAAELVLERIRSLERDLGVPAESAYDGPRVSASR